MKIELEYQLGFFCFLSLFMFIQGNFQNGQWELENGGFRLSGKRESIRTTLGNRRRGGRRGSSNYNVLMEAASDGHISQQELQRFTPRPVSPGEVNCNFEVEQSVYVTHQGRCIRLGSTGIHACQGNGYMDVNNIQCVSRAASTTQLPQPSEPTTSTLST